MADDACKNTRLSQTNYSLTLHLAARITRTVLPTVSGIGTYNIQPGVSKVTATFRRLITRRSLTAVE